MKRVSLGLALLGSTALAGAAVAQQQPIQIVGSSTVYPFATVVAENFGRKTEYPTPVIESTGSGGGLQIFCQGVGPDTADVTNASRRIKPSEVELCESNGVAGIHEVLIGYDALTLATNQDAPDFGLTLEEVWRAVAKEVVIDGEVVANPYTNWSDINPELPDYRIEILGPPPTSGTRDSFVELGLEVGCEEAVEGLDEETAERVCATVREDGRFIEAGENDNLIVQQLEASPQAVGVFGFSFLDQNRDVLKPIALDGVDPAFETAADGSYPMSRSMYFYVKVAHVGVIPGLREYVAEWFSPEAGGMDGYLAERGLVPPPQDVRQRQEEAAETMAATDLSDL
jgi:phosphate transport system substrate-binding protein